jgi:hypothetical protein
MLFSTVTILAYLLRIFEYPYFVITDEPSNIRSMLTSYWLIIITLTTVGYGDITPTTFFGKFVCIITAFWGSFIVSFCVLVVNNAFALSE